MNINLFLSTLSINVIGSFVLFLVFLIQWNKKRKQKSTSSDVTILGAEGGRVKLIQTLKDKGTLLLSIAFLIATVFFGRTEYIKEVSKVNKRVIMEVYEHLEYLDEHPYIYRNVNGKETYFGCNGTISNIAYLQTTFTMLMEKKQVYVTAGIKGGPSKLMIDQTSYEAKRFDPEFYNYKISGISSYKLPPTRVSGHIDSVLTYLESSLNMHILNIQIRKEIKNWNSTQNIDNPSLGAINLKQPIIYKLRSIYLKAQDNSNFDSSGYTRGSEKYDGINRVYGNFFKQEGAKKGVAAWNVNDELWVIKYPDAYRMQRTPDGVIQPGYQRK